MGHLGLLAGLFRERDSAEETIGIVTRAGGEEELIGRSVGGSTLTDWMAQSWSISIGWPVASRSGPRKSPVSGLKALIRPREILLLIRIALLIGPKLAGACAMPHGE